MKTPPVESQREETPTKAPGIRVQNAALTSAIPYFPRTTPSLQRRALCSSAFLRVNPVSIVEGATATQQHRAPPSSDMDRHTPLPQIGGEATRSPEGLK